MSTLVKVTMEFSDGEIRQLEGEEANKWLEELNNICVFSVMHGCPMSDSKWTIINKVKTEDKKN